MAARTRPQARTAGHTARGRCRATEMTVAGFARPHGSTQVVVEHPSGGIVRGTRGADGTIVALRADGEVLLLQHRSDAARIAELLAARGYTHPLRGWSVELGLDPAAAVAAGCAERCSVDPSTLDGGYPSDCPEQVRRDIGAVMAQIGQRWGVSRADMRAVRAAVIHAGVETDWALTPAQMLTVAAERIPALRALRSEPRPGGNGRRSRNAAARREPTARDLLRALSDHATPGEALRWQVATGSDRDMAAALLDRDPATIAPGAVVLVRRDAAGRVDAAVADPAGTDGATHPSSSSSLTDPATAEFLRRFEQSRRNGDARRSGTFCFGCNRGIDACTCPRGAAFSARLLAIGRAARDSSEFETIEHRWGSEYARRLTPADRAAAAERVDAVRARVGAVLGKTDTDELERIAGSDVFENLAMFERQTGHRLDDLAPGAVEVLCDELFNAAYRAEDVHRYTSALRELDVAFEPGTVEMYLGRDGRYFYEARRQMQESGVGATDREVVYVSGSRGYRRASENGQIRQFADRPVVMIDTGFVGSIPEDIHRHFGVGVVAERGRRSSLMRLMCSTSEPARGFASQLDRRAATIVEHDAHPARSSRTIGFGDDRGAPTSAFEQLVSRQLTASVRRSVREWAASPPPLSDAERVAAFYTTEQVAVLKHAQIPDDFLIEAGRSGMTVDDVLMNWAERTRGDRSDAEPAPIPRTGRIAGLFSALTGKRAGRHGGHGPRAAA